MTITCTSCKKPVAFDPATTRSEKRLRLSNNATSTVTYYPVCPHCKTQLAATQEQKP